MRASLLALVLTLAFAAPASADIVNAEGGAGAGGHRLTWALAFDDVADTVTIDATHARFSGAEQAGPPQVAQINLILPNGNAISVNLITARLGTGQLFDGNAATMINSGPRTRTNVRLRLSPRRSRLIEFTTDYSPPA